MRGGYAAPAGAQYAAGGRVSDGCKHCGHLIGYHHAWVKDPDEMLCTAGKDGGNCDCPGYEDPDPVETGFQRFERLAEEKMAKR